MVRIQQMLAVSFIHFSLYNPIDSSYFVEQSTKVDTSEIHLVSGLLQSPFISIETYRDRGWFNFFCPRLQVGGSSIF